VIVTNILRFSAKKRVRPQLILSPIMPVGISINPAISKCIKDEIKIPELPKLENTASTVVPSTLNENAVPRINPSVIPKRLIQKS